MTQQVFTKIVQLAIHKAEDDYDDLLDIADDLDGDDVWPEDEGTKVLQLIKTLKYPDLSYEESVRKEVEHFKHEIKTLIENPSLFYAEYLL